MKRGKIIIISGPSGSGKTTLYKKLLADRKFKGGFVRSISVTTRPRRICEKHGRDYFFVTRKMFFYKKRKGHFLESECVFGNYYGTPGKNVRDLLRAGKNVLLCIDVKGARTVCRKFSQAVTVFVKAPSVAALARRLKARKSEGKEAIRLRIERSRKELREAKRYQHVIVNGRLGDSHARLKEIIENELL